jgi:DNA-binding MarR family transcriptional regulator
MSGQHNIPHQIVEIIPLVLRFLHSEMRFHAGGLGPSHFRLLETLASHPCNLSEIAERHSLSMPTISNSVNLLVERGWILRTPASRDRRMVFIELTPTGKQVLFDSQQRLEKQVGQRVAGLSPEELEKLEAGLQILRQVLEPSAVEERSCE